MDTELQAHIIDIKSLLSGQSAKLDAVKENVDQHILRDEAKFKDLYERHSDHDKFQARAKGYTKGAAALMAVVVTIATTAAKAMGLI